MKNIFYFLIFLSIVFAIPLLIAFLVVALTKFKISKAHKRHIKNIFILAIPLILSATVVIKGGEQIISGSITFYAKGGNAAHIYTLEHQPIYFILASAAYLAVFISGLCLASKIYNTIFTHQNSNP